VSEKMKMVKKGSRVPTLPYCCHLSNKKKEALCNNLCTNFLKRFPYKKKEGSRSHRRVRSLLPPLPWIRHWGSGTS